jgi:hypothetical protein
VVDQLALPRPLKVRPSVVVVSSNPQLPARCSGHGLTLSVFTPFASPTSPIGRVGDVMRGDHADVERTLSIELDVIMPTIGIGYSAHSPELPHFSIRRSAPDIPGAILPSNGSHNALTIVSSCLAFVVLLSKRIHPS